MMMKIDQSQYASWTDVAGIRVFLHDKRELIYPESVSITVTPGTASSIVIVRVRYCLTFMHNIRDGSNANLKIN